MEQFKGSILANLADMAPKLATLAAEVDYLKRRVNTFERGQSDAP